MADAAPIITYRTVAAPMSPADVSAVAALHYASWRVAYADVFPEAYLNGDGDASKDHNSGSSDDSQKNSGGGLRQHMQDMWAARARDCIPDAAQWRLVLAEAGAALAGFVCVNATEEREHGVLLDNLHVAAAFRRRGIARALVGFAADFVARAFPQQPMHLTCLAANEVARPFYAALGGELRDGPVWRPEGGKPASCVRYVWQPQQLPALAAAAAAAQ